MKYFGLIFLMLVGQIATADVGDVLRGLHVQDGGRVKPYDSFANEALQLVYGKKTFKVEKVGQKTEKKGASEIIFTWMLVPDFWSTVPVVEIRHKGLREALRLTGDEKYYAPQDLFSNDRLPLLLQEVRTLRERQEKLNPYYQAVQRLENQLGMFQAIRAGEALRIVPDPASDTWKSVAHLEGPTKEAFAKITQEFIKSVSESQGKEETGLRHALTEFMELAKKEKPEAYGSEQKVKTEVWYNRFHPFQWAWISYLIGVLCLMGYMTSKRENLNRAAWLGLIVGFALHTLGMAIRSYLSGRPPVTNMYETVVWVPWGVVLFAFVLERMQKAKLLLLCASAVAVFCLILTDLSPTVLDGTIQPLEPVLRSTFWLSTHVLIITISYAAFFLAFALGDLLLFYYLRDEKKYAVQIRQGTNSIYRALQIGIVLLAAGIILGGIWADYSWGRFWGWDPKETWALIALLGYLALLHGRLVGWVKNFELAALSIVAFSLVIMAWYGVNFVLGAGLHSYGFGAGGVEYVSGFVVLHLLYVAYVSTVRYGRLKNK